MKCCVVFLIALVHCALISIGAGLTVEHDSNSSEKKFLPKFRPNKLSEMIKEVERHRRQLDDLQKLISDGVSKDMLNDGLVLAAHLNMEQVVDLLLKSGADANATDQTDHETPLHLTRDEKIAELLIENGADVNQRDRTELMTPLHLHSIGGHKGVVEILIEHGADANAKEKHDYTALHFAAKFDKKEVAELLIKKGGAKVHALTSYKHQTPLHLAADGASVEAVKVLLENGADRSLLDDDGRTALALAENMWYHGFREKYEQIVEILKANE